ncbi:MAG: 1-acyl-sn-glycerol-3-phosphate acyltransferase [Rhodobacteraceae bacterium]|nr:1-acyl-sn-glycerol-3-phosphate acyltransferase [Paracoccaceae bacterium]
MSPTWHSADQPALARIGPAGWALVALRGLPLVVITYGGLVLLLLIRLVERPLCGEDRPVTPFITQAVCRATLILLGIRLGVRGTPMRGTGAVVANHASWLDIFTLNAVQRVYFVSKSEVAAWPGIGWLARATGTLFISRSGREAAAQKRQLEARLNAGHRLAFFPEGTSTDGQRVLPFKSTLFAAFFSPGLGEVMRLQPVSLRYTPANGQDPRHYAWWGDMAFGPHFLTILASTGTGRVDVIFHPPVRVADFADRKSLAAHCEAQVRDGMTRGITPGHAPQ